MSAKQTQQPSRSTKIALTIAGSDPSGGAGLQADLKTFHQHGVYGMSVVTLLTVQNTREVSAVETLDPDFITRQIAAVVSDIPPQAAKTGALGSVAIVECVAKAVETFEFPLVVDPVMVSKHGHSLIAPEVTEALKQRLIPKAFFITPNLYEAQELTGLSIHDEAGMTQAAKQMMEMGAQNVVIKGGGHPSIGYDLLACGDGTEIIATELIDTRNTHGSGCVFSAAIAARLARGEDARSAALGSKRFITDAIRTNPGLGEGRGPVNLFTSAERYISEG
ncbi:MAG: bifunctional hydroxymethylpyrimidine kinase/phosphomethylpyrimidine kinase [bacterium]|nr:bifunctional hydroxymethylpyrimidine kinase/phosphomethylpyrimidine kinase [bacterium]